MLKNEVVWCGKGFRPYKLNSQFIVTARLRISDSDTIQSSEFTRIYALSAYIVPRQQNNLVSVSGNRCLVPWSVIPVDASDSFDTILDVVRAGKYDSETIQKCDTEVRPSK